MEKNSALLIIDVQNDFCPGGALPIPNGDRVIEPINRAAQLFAAARLPVFASRDWHPPKSRHFRDFGGVWPVHCVQETVGAAFHPALRLPGGTIVISKGIIPELDGYSAFEGVTVDGRMLAELLHKRQVRELYICGLATDYCVLCTTREALRNGFKVTVLTDAVAGVDLNPGASADAVEEMERDGAKFATVDGVEAASNPE